jgi:hypothetical protein
MGPQHRSEGSLYGDHQSWARLAQLYLEDLTQQSLDAWLPVDYDRRHARHAERPVGVQRRKDDIHEVHAGIPEDFDISKCLDSYFVSDGEQTEVGSSSNRHMASNFPTARSISFSKLRFCQRD